jgi:hypothetical protein
MPEPIQAGNPFAEQAPKTPEKQEVRPPQIDTILNNLAEIQHELAWQDFLAIIQYVFENSVEDGLKFAEKLKLNPDEIVMCCTGPNFRLKHPQIHQRILKFATTNKDKIAAHYFDLLAEESEPVDIKPTKHLALKLQDQRARDIFLQLQASYTHLLKQRRIRAKSEMQDSGKSQGELMAERHLADVALALQDSYYSSGVRKTLTELSKHAHLKIAPGWEEFLQNHNIVTKSEIDALCLNFSVNYHDLAKDKYILYSNVHGMVKAAAVAELRKELKESLADTDQTIELNPKTNRYEVVPIEGTAEPGEKVEKLDASILDPNLYPATISNGRLFFEFTGTILNERGQEIDKRYDTVDTPTDINGTLYFRVFHNNQCFVANEHGDEFLRDKSEDQVISDIFECQNKPYFIGRDPAGQFIATPKSWIFQLDSLDGEMTFIGADDKNITFIIKRNDGEVHKIWLDPTGEMDYASIVDPLCSMDNYSVHHGDEILFQEAKFDKQTGKRSAHIYDEIGRQLYESDGSIKLELAAELNNVLYFVVKDTDGNECLATYDKTYPTKYDAINNLAAFDNQIYMQVSLNGKSTIVNEQGEIIGARYTETKIIGVEKGKLIYLGQADDGSWEKVTVNPKEKKKEKEVIHEKDENILDIHQARGFLYYRVQNKNTKKQKFIREDGAVIHFTGDKEVTGIVEIKGKLYFSVYTNIGDQSILTENGQRLYDEFGNPLSEKYDQIYAPEEINGKLFFSAVPHGKDGSIIVDEDGKEYGHELNGAHHPISLNGELYYVGSDAAGEYIIRDKPHKAIHIPGIKSIESILVLNGQIYAITIDKKKTIIINQKGEKFGEQYEDISLYHEPVLINGKHYFLAAKKTQRKT